MRSQQDISPALDQDQFLRTPALFKFGPLVLLVVGVALMAGTIVAGQWRVVEGRKGEYEKAFVTASAAATSATEQFNVMLERLNQVTHQAVTLEDKLGKGVSISDRHAEGLTLPGLDVRSVVITTSDKVVPLTNEGALPPGFLSAVRAASWNAKAQDSDHYVQALGADGASTLGVAVVSRVKNSPMLREVVHVIGPQALSRITERSLGPMEGRLKLLRGDGTTFVSMEKLEKGTTVAAVAADMGGDVVVRDAEQAMAVPLDFKSSRWLSTEGVVAKGGLRAQVALREAAILTEFERRVGATWLIIGVASACWMALAVLIAVALLKFSSKEKYLRRLATTDLLTGLPNRRSFSHLLNTLVNKCRKSDRPLALFLVDVDNFKDVNDTLGHPVGDALLQFMAKQLGDCVRGDDVVCRLAGDEFTVVAANISTVEEAEVLGARILKATSKVFSHESNDITCGASVGVALMPLHTKDEAELMQYADTALYRAKRAGRGRVVVYDATMTQQDVARTTTVRDLSTALSTADELFLVYQPKYQLANGQLTGHEALIRWQHPSRGMVFPNDFIPVAEQAGLIGELGNWVIRRAVRQIREWADAGMGWHKVAVNVSALQLRDDSLVKVISDALGQHRVSGRYLQIELTESTLAENAKAAVEVLRHLRVLGVTVAVDDFGTGYSCLGTLRDFEVDCLKVDRSFVKNIALPGGSNICRAIISLAHSLNTTVVAEGVETAEQAQALAELGCNEVQGYYFAKPQPAELAPTLTQTRAFLPCEEPVTPHTTTSQVVALVRNGG